ncbi:MAG: hypothetical protein NUV49_00915 [Patescibacteria group bacterium]|nr:hypothetical protein [Patescibacteria group bacterium]
MNKVNQTIEYIVKVSPNGAQHWYFNGKLHREDDPAIVSDRTQHWYLNGKLHREDGPAIEWRDGTQQWYLNGNFHREDGPAIVYSGGAQHWYLNGNLHREDGPAVVRPDGTQQWYLNGKSLSEAEHKAQTQPKKLSPCAGQTVTIDGVDYVLTPKE